MVGGLTYDVSFVNALDDPTYATVPPTFLGNPSGAADAVDALSAAFNELGVIGLTGEQPGVGEAALAV
jgi:hypothetical protein